MVENTLFSHIVKILEIYPRLDEYISFPFSPDSRTGVKRLCGHILVSSKGDQTYYIIIDLNYVPRIHTVLAHSLIDVLLMVINQRKLEVFLLSCC